MTVTAEKKPARQRQPAPATAKTDGKPLSPCAMVLFGASGDLTKRKLIPALYNLADQGLLPKEFALIGISRKPMDAESYRRYLDGEVRKMTSETLDEKAWKDLLSRFYYIAGDGNDPQTYAKINDMLGQVKSKHKTGGNVLFYLATAPELFAPTVEQCEKAGLTKENGGVWRRFIIEKPFGHDLESARTLNRKLRKALKENQIYRIDHYLGKETVQNILVFRFANGIFEPIWNRRYIDHVQITVAEDLGVEQRGGYFDKTGTLRDMVPNHIFQLISLTAMEPPISFAADAVRDEQTKVLRAIAPMMPEEVLKRSVRGQYGPGTVNGVKVPAYRSEPSVSSTSTAETFVALKLFIDSWRWADVPFYVRTGKRMPCRATEIVIQFKKVPLVLFRDVKIEHLSRNQIVIRIQPDEGIALSFEAKIPGPMVRTGRVDMDFRYRDYFTEHAATGYERLLYDCMMGDATLFRRADMVEASWSVVAPILEFWKSQPPKSFPNYAAGTWGPPEAMQLVEKDGGHWRGCMQGSCSKST